MLNPPVGVGDEVDCRSRGVVGYLKSEQCCRHEDVVRLERIVTIGPVG